MGGFHYWPTSEHHAVFVSSSPWTQRSLPVLWCFMFVIFTSWSWFGAMGVPLLIEWNPEPNRKRHEGDKSYTNVPQTALNVLKALPFTSKTVPDTETNTVTPLIKRNMLTASVSISQKTPTKTYLSNIQTLVTFHYTDWFMGIRDPYTGLLQSLYNWLGSIIPIYIHIPFHLARLDSLVSLHLGPKSVRPKLAC